VQTIPIEAPWLALKASLALERVLAKVGAFGYKL